MEEKESKLHIRCVTKEDLPRLAELINSPELATREDICFEHSKLRTDNDGNIIAFIISRKHSLYDFFGGDIPEDESVDKTAPDYDPGDEGNTADELLMRWAVSCFSIEKHLEIIYWYLAPNKDYTILDDVYSFTFNVSPLLKWTPISDMIEHIPIKYLFDTFNDVIFIDIPRVD